MSTVVINNMTCDPIRDPDQIFGRAPCVSEKIFLSIGHKLSEWISSKKIFLVIFYLQMTPLDISPTQNNSSAKPPLKLAQIRRGLLEFAVLIIIRSADPAMTSAEILEKLSRAAFTSTRGTLHPLLSKLRRQEMIRNFCDEQDEGNVRKCFYITEAGSKLLNEFLHYWVTLDLAFESLDSRS